MPPRKRKQVARETATDPPAASSSSSALQPAKMTVAVLRGELESRGLDTRGKKAELVARLEASLAGSSPTKKPRKQEPKPEPKEEEEEHEDSKVSKGGVANMMCPRDLPSMDPGRYRFQ